MPTNNHSTISLEMRERMRIMSRMTKEEKVAYRWKCYDDKAKPQLLELIEYCQSNNRICPWPQDWNRIWGTYSRYSHRSEFTEYPPFKIPLILGAWDAPYIDKRQRFLTQIYWCYKNYFMGSMYKMVMGLTEDDWYKCQPKTKMPIMLDEIKLSLTIIKKEYAGWLGVNYYPKHNVFNYWITHDYCFIKEPREIREPYDFLDDESITYIRDR